MALITLKIITIIMWSQEFNDLLENTDDYCQTNNISIEVWKKELVERGILSITKGKETEEHLYFVQLPIQPGTWTMRVKIDNEEQGIEGFKDFILFIESD